MVACAIYGKQAAFQHFCFAEKNVRLSFVVAAAGKAGSVVENRVVAIVSVSFLTLDV